ncbi:MAG: hypothetical protein RL753_850, partial [Bacteroidota bacterium]
EHSKDSGQFHTGLQGVVKDNARPNQGEH